MIYSTQSFHYLLINGLKTSIVADGGFDEVMTQVMDIDAECEMRDGKVVCVRAPDGIVFRGEKGTLTRPDHFDVTAMCDLDDITKRVIADIEERAEDAAMRGSDYDWGMK